MKFIILLLLILSGSAVNAQQKIDADFFTQKNDGLLRYTETGETYIRRIIADGWFTDTTSAAKNWYHHPYDIYSVSQKPMNDESGFVFYRYSKGKRSDGIITDSLFFTNKNTQIFFSGTYKDGLLEGKAEMYFTRPEGIAENKKLKSLGSFEHGEAVGEWRNYLPTGELRDKREYAKGIGHPVKITNYFKDGSIEYISEFLKDGTRQYINMFYPGGQVLSTKILTKATNGTLLYNYAEYFPGGNIKTKGMMEEGNMQSHKIGNWEIYDEAGNKAVVTCNENER